MLKMFIMEGCPYCKAALGYLDELTKEDKYKDIKVKLIDEQKEADYANSFDYYYVPTIYDEDVKLHEGAMEKEDLIKIFDNYLKK